MNKFLQRLFGMEMYPADVRKSLTLIIMAVLFGNIWSAIVTGTPLTGFANMLGAGDFMFGVMMGVPVLGSAFQMLASALLERTRNRRKMIIISGLVQRGIWLLIAAAPLIVPIEGSWLRIFIVILAITVHNIGGSFLNISFFSILGDLVPGDTRGRYLASRSRVATISALVGGLICAFFLDLVDSLWGYSVVFAIAALLGIADILCFIGVKEPEMAGAGEKRGGMGTAFKEALGNKSFKRILMFWLTFMFGTNIAGPYFTRYALTDMKATQLQYFLLDAVIVNIITIIIVKKWGVLMDRFGQKPILRIGAFIAAFTPFCWLLTGPGQLWALPMVAIVGGVGWSAVNLVNANMMVSQLPEKNRTVYIATYFIVIQAVGTALPNILGGWVLGLLRSLVETLGWGINPYKLLFVLSSLLRFASALIFLPMLTEKGAGSAGEVLAEVKSGLVLWHKHMRFGLRTFRIRRRARKYRDE